MLSDRLNELNTSVRRVPFLDYDSDSLALVKMYLNGEFLNNLEDVNAYAASSFYVMDCYAFYKKDWKADYERGIIIADRYTHLMLYISTVSWKRKNGTTIWNG